jgi:GT2 family glycosyltransferase
VSAAVSIVVPALGPSPHLERALLALDGALAPRGWIDELVVVDDSGRGELADWVALRCRGARTLARTENGGFARALGDGVRAARHALVFAMNSDLEPRAGFLEPLIDALQDPRGFAAVPRVLRRGAGEQRVESLVRLVEREGRVQVEQPFVERDAPARVLAGPCALPFALGGAFLVRRDEFLRLGGFDALFEPFYMEDVDLSWRARRAGRTCLHVPDSLCVHENQATIARVAPRELIEAAEAKNRLLFEWLHLDGAALERHLQALDELALTAWLEEDRVALEILALALEQLEGALAARAAAPRADPFEVLARACDPLR